MYDCIGVGVGPSNLSMAALAEPIKQKLNISFLEGKEIVDWHPGMLLKDTKMQIHFCKDLVTLVDPTSPYSFLNYLSKSGRLCQFFNKKLNIVSRHEFCLYLRWVADKLSNIQFDKNVREITFDSKGYFELFSDTEKFRSKNIVIGVGLEPNIPSELNKLLPKTVFHSSEFAFQKQDFNGKTVMVVGGGQSGQRLSDHCLICQLQRFQIS